MFCGTTIFDKQGVTAVKQFREQLIRIDVRYEL
jgi:hypothetical protein